MRTAALALLIGTIVLQHLPSLPDPRWSWLLLAALPAAGCWPRGRWLLFGLIGFCWAGLAAQAQLAGALAPEMEGEDVQVTGLIASLPRTAVFGTRFEFQPETLTWRGQARPPPGRLLLNWYEGAPPLRAGERWRLTLRLKQPHGFLNPGGFDYEGWLFQQGIRATGYVRGGADHPHNRRLDAAGGDFRVNRLRQALRERIDAALAGRALSGVVQALALGDQQGITNAQWELLTRTGTIHLVAISGLHVSLVAGGVFFLVRRLWRCSAAATRRWPAAKAAALAAASAALGYALLAGFSVPTQRALIMIAVAMLGLWLQRRTRPGDLLALALILVILWDPFAVLSIGFWLSFASVAIILYGMHGRLGEGDDRWRRAWWRWGRVQWLVTLGLLPLLVLLFQKASLVSPLANLLAVPWVNLVTVPLTLSGALGLLLWPPLGEGLLRLAEWSLQGLWHPLEFLGQWPWAQWRQGAAPGWTLAAAAAGVVWLVLPRGVPARWVGGIWLLPLGLASGPAVAPGEAHVALLDVGQGLAAVVQTRAHVLVFDTGPEFRSGFNTGEAVVAPYLRHRGIGAVDSVIISHGDSDHRGGLAGLLDEMPAGRLLSSVPLPQGMASEPCQAGQTWQWDGVVFEMLSPEEPQPGSSARAQGNNASCVLRVRAGGQRLLLTGDIERATELRLVRTLGEGLTAEVLVAPHHGSATSSSAEFLQAVDPEIALFPAGYRNRYGFPKPQVVARYRERGVQLYDSAHHGAIELRLGGTQGLRAVATYRQNNLRYWRHLVPETARAAD